MNKMAIIIILLGLGLLTLHEIKEIFDNEKTFNSGAFDKEIDKILKDSPTWKGNPDDKAAIAEWKLSYMPGYKPKIIKMDRPSIEDKTGLAAVIEFLFKDTISDKSYGMGPYQCTQFSRDLSAAAKKAGIAIGGIILGNSPNLETYSNHALNYIIIDNVFYIINPDSDFITPWDQYIHKDRYKYYKLYPDGTQLPTTWKDKLYNVYPTSMLSGKQ